MLIGYAIGSRFQATGLFLLCWFFYSLMYDFADVPFEIEAFSFFTKIRAAVVQETQKSHSLLVSYGKTGTFRCKRPLLPAACLSCTEKYFSKYFFPFSIESP